jgi:hypothetical protein
LNQHSSLSTSCAAGERDWEEEEVEVEDVESDEEETVGCAIIEDDVCDEEE